MTDSILDNQQITADILSSISIDLGNDDLSFTQTEKFGADKLNKITGDLVSAGILSGGSNHGNDCEIYTTNNKIYIKSGIIVFADGKKKTVDNDMEIGQLTDCCIYALNDVSSNTIKLITDTSYPTKGDFVKLAHVVNSIVIDDRKIAVSKFNASGSRIPLTIQKTVTASLSKPAEISLTNAPIGTIYGEISAGSYYNFFVYNAYNGKFYYNADISHPTEGLGLGLSNVTFTIVDSVLKIYFSNNTTATLNLDMVAI